MTSLAIGHGVSMHLHVGHPWHDLWTWSITRDDVTLVRSARMYKSRARAARACEAAARRHGFQVPK